MSCHGGRAHHICRSGKDSPREKNTSALAPSDNDNDYSHSSTISTIRSIKRSGSGKNLTVVLLPVSQTCSKRRQLTGRPGGRIQSAEYSI